MGEKGYTYVGPAEMHEPILGGASEFQMTLMGGGHHPRCQHYEWGPCTCYRYEDELPPPPPTANWWQRLCNKTRAGFRP